MNDLGVWPTIWYWVLMIGGGLFLLTLCYSVVAGARDIKQMLHALGGEQGEANGAAGSGDEDRRPGI